MASRKSFPPAPWNFDRFIPQRQIVINELNDFPAPVGGVIYLEDRVQYLIGTNMSIGTNRLVMGAFTVIKGVDLDNARIEYLGSGDMITADNVTFLMDNLTVKCEFGRLFKVTDSLGAFTRIINLDVSEANDLGSFQSSANAILLAEGLIATSISDGLDFTGNFNIVQLSLASDVQFAGTFFDLGTATFNSIGLSEVSCFLASPSATFISGLPNSGNINSGGLARVTNCVVNNLGGGTILDGVTEDDTRWRFLGNQNIRNSRADALSSFSGNSTATVIVAVNTPVKINATWTEGPVSQFTVDSSGTITFTGEVDFRCPIDIVVTLEGTTGSAIDYKVYVAINDTVVTDSGMVITDVTNTKFKSGGTVWQHTFVNGDTLDFYIENIDSTDNVVVQAAVGRVN